MKLAVTDLSPFMVTVVGLIEPVTDPLQLEKEYPLARVAVKVTTVPEVYLPPVQLATGLTPTLPLPLGLTEVVNE